MRNSTRKRMIRKWLEGGKPAARKKDEPMKSWKHAMQDPGFQAIIKLEHTLDKHWNVLGCCEHVVDSGDNAGRYLHIEAMGVWQSRLASARIIAKKTGGNWNVKRVDVNRIMRKPEDVNVFVFETSQSVVSNSTLQTMANEMSRLDRQFLQTVCAGPFNFATDEELEMLDDWKWADKLPWEQVA